MALATQDLLQRIITKRGLENTLAVPADVSPKTHSPYPAEFRKQLIELVHAGRTLAPKVIGLLTYDGTFKRPIAGTATDLSGNFASFVGSGGRKEKPPSARTHRRLILLIKLGAPGRIRTHYPLVRSKLN